MISFTATIKKFDNQGEKTGWTYIEVPVTIAQELKPGNKKSFAVKGKLDHCAIRQVSLLPMGEGNFIMPLNAAIRKRVRKHAGAAVQVSLAADETPFEMNKTFLECLDDEPAAATAFRKLSPSHQKYFGKWIESAKTETTRTKRIAAAVTALARGDGYGEMIRGLKNNRIQ